jgi:teichoic acid transport system permease protein
MGQPGVPFDPTPPVSGVPAPQPWQPFFDDGSANVPSNVTAETVAVPRIQALETAILPKVVEPPEEPPSLVELARRHGLTPAGSRPALGTYLGQLWRYREFIGTYANGRTVAAFGESRLGRLWQVLTPLLNAGVYFLIFGVILGTRTGVGNFIGYLCVGLFIFNYTSTVVSAAIQSISGQLGLVRALQFPRASLPVATTLVQVQNLVASIIVLVGIIVGTGEPITIEWIWLVPTLILQSFFNLGLALALARLGAKMHDLKHLIPYLLRIWMYGSGVLYSVHVFVQHLPAWAVAVVHANPLLVYIELGRHSLMESPPLASTIMELWVMAGAWAFVSCVFGFLYFWRGESEYGRG